MKKIKLAHAENLEFMTLLNKYFLKQTTGCDGIKFIYIDPPFNTLRNQQKNKTEIGKNIHQLKYYDNFGEGVEGYIEFMKQRLKHCYRLLSDDGFLCVHLDFNSVHYIKKELDYIFGGGVLDKGRNHLVNEIIVKRRKGKNLGSLKKLNVDFDTLLVYSKK